MSLELLSDFEREQLSKKKTSTNPFASTKGPCYPASFIDELMAHEDIIVSYGASPIASKVANSRQASCSPATPVSKFNEKNGRPPSTPPSRRLTASHHLYLSPSVAVPSERYSTRNNSGAVVSTYISQGTAAPDFTTKDWTANMELPIEVQVTSMQNCRGRLMFEKLRESAAIADDVIMHMAEQLEPAFGGAGCWGPMDTPSNEAINCVGRVCCDSVGKLNAASVLLEGSRELSGAVMLPLDLSKLDSYALFPGQVIGVSGVNSTGNLLVVEKLIAGRVPELPEHPISLKGTLEIVIASGPFTTSDNLLYEPLQDLLDTIAKSPPHVLVLLGPVLDASHPLLSEGSVNETFQAVVNRAISSVTNALSKCNTKIFIVSSSRDVTASCVYPTPPLSAPVSPRLTLVSDPSLLVIDGVVIAVTAQDVIMDIGKEELAYPSQQGDRIHRLVHHVLAQQSLYPVYPSPDHVAVSPSLLQAHASLNFKPHILVVPSDLRNFVKNVFDCVVVNPERLCKGKSGGCYARLEIIPPSENNASVPEVEAAVYRV
ncbi:DNA polymerase alpha subunit B isoform X2 [Hyalella azteca]|nr:DNA polymerase alpha subunit B isoform X2 [Hyalella azteca]